ncbi:hypothetical protein [Amycolatopsis sp. NPDC049868]|uniref:hypothetical protein n=1 Tax=Amycolatopsis sp. NPDC049868 TaxID=3363934 RepID=UPI0037B60873
MATSAINPIDLYETVRKHWGAFSPGDNNNAYFATYTMGEIANYLWGALPDKTSELYDEMIMQLAQTLRYLGLTLDALPSDAPYEGAELTRACPVGDLAAVRLDCGRGWSW